MTIISRKVCTSDGLEPEISSRDTVANAFLCYLHIVQTISICLDTTKWTEVSAERLVANQPQGGGDRQRGCTVGGVEEEGAPAD